MLVNMSDEYHMYSQPEYLNMDKRAKGEDLQAMQAIRHMALGAAPPPMLTTRTNGKKTKRPAEQHPYYITMTYDPNARKTTIRSSRNLRDNCPEIMHEAQSRMSKLCRQHAETTHSIPTKSQRRAAEYLSQEEDEIRSSKRRRPSHDVEVSLDETSEDESVGTPEDEDPDDNTVCFRADARADWENWLTDAFRAVQQVSCRVIAKEWIKTIHPRKQSTHPYNGRNPRTGASGDSSDTKPPYWPRHVRHKEPDHINKDERMQLLVHLLMNTPHQEMTTTGEVRSTREITAEVLKESLDQKKREHQQDQLRKKFTIIENIIHVRTQLEQYEAGGMPPHATFTAPNYSDFGRGNKHFDEDGDDADDSETIPPNANDWDSSELIVSPDNLTTPVVGHSLSQSASQPSSTASYSRRASGSESSLQHTAVPHQVSYVVPPGYHPPMQLPPDAYQSEAMSTAIHLYQGHPTHDYAMANGYIPSSWSEHIQTPVMSGSYDSNMMVSPTPMSAVSSHGHFSENSVSASAPIGYVTMSHPPRSVQYVSGPMGQQSHIMRATTPYEHHYMQGQMQGNESMHQQYYR